MAESHFRSTQSASIIAPAQLTVRLKNMFLQRALDLGLGLFWTPSGGFIPKDGLTPFAVFHGDKTIRGGRIFADFTNVGLRDSLKVQVYLIWAAPEAEPAVLTPFLAPLAITREFDPSHIPDFKRFGRIVMSRETILMAGAAPWHVEYRLKPQKLDSNVYGAGGSQLYWMYTVGSYIEADSVVNSVQAIFSYSLSFTGDVIAETV